VKIRLTINGQRRDGTLANTPAAQDFYARLPLRLTLDDYARTEKIAYLAEPLSGEGAPAGFAPRAGDIAYYAPWGNLAIFYRNFGYSTGLVQLARLEGDTGILAAPGPLEILIEPDGAARR
jgi:hypothetical protein